MRVALDPDDRSKAIAVIVNPTIASRLVGKKLEIGTVSRGGSASLSKEPSSKPATEETGAPGARASCPNPTRTTRTTATAGTEGPPSVSQFKKRAAGTYDSKAGQKLARQGPGLHDDGSITCPLRCARRRWKSARTKPSDRVFELSPPPKHHSTLTRFICSCRRLFVGLQIGG